LSETFNDLHRHEPSVSRRLLSKRLSQVPSSKPLWVDPVDPESLHIALKQSC